MRQKPKKMVSLNTIASAFSNVVEPIIQASAAPKDWRRRGKHSLLGNPRPLVILRRDVAPVYRKDGSPLIYPGTKTPVMVHLGVESSRLRQMQYKKRRADAGRWVN